MKILEFLHIASNLISGGLLGVGAVVVFLLLKKEVLPETRKICYDLINFNLSYLIYFVIGFASLFILVGFVLLPILYIVWIVTMILGAIRHIAGERYSYPLTISFLS